MKLLSAAKHIVKTLIGREKIRFEPVIKDIPVITNKASIFYDNLDETKLITANKNQYKHLIDIDGIGFSGSSAVTDFLAEFSNCTVWGGVDLRENPERGCENGFEFDFIRTPGGVLDLERICTHNCSRIKDKAIHDFIEVTESYYHSTIPFFNDDYFYNQSKKFLKNIIAFAFADSESHITYCTKKITLQEYRNYAHEYIKSILNNIPSKEYLVCDNLMSIGFSSAEILNDYFGNYKKIYSWCDPRDVYARARLMPGNDWVPKNPEIFVMNFKHNHAIRINNPEKNTLLTNFDDFCNNYELESKKIMDFLEITEDQHTEKYKYFNPKISINNTGVWRKLEDQKPIEYIFENLKEYCYDIDNHKHYL